MPPTILVSSFGAAFIGFFFVMLYVLFIAFLTIVTSLLTVLKIMMIIDCARKRFDDSTGQVVWFLVILLVPLGSLIYLFALKLRDSESPGLFPRKTANRVERAK